jgi:short-subunit dehydrogenase
MNSMNGKPRPLALVTGASGGIGAELARELARDGHDLVLAARHVGPMQALAEELKIQGATCVILAADLSDPDSAGVLAAEIEARGFAIDVLINNAGLGASGLFHESDLTRIREMVMVNVLALTELTRLLVPGMVARRRGRIMLVGSTAGFQPGPHMAVYCATKAYVLSFGESIRYELRGTGVTVTVLCPGATATNFSATAQATKTALFSLTPVMPASAVARTGYRGMKEGKPVVVTGLSNKLLGFGGRFMPRFVSLPISAFLMRGR